MITKIAKEIIILDKVIEKSFINLILRILSMILIQLNKSSKKILKQHLLTVVIIIEIYR